MAAILKTFAGLNFYTRTCFIDYYHISFKKSHQTLRPISCRVNQIFDISWILDLGLHGKIYDLKHLVVFMCIFSSPEPSGSQGELIVYPCSVVRPSVRRPSVVRPSVVHNFQRSSSLKPLGQSKPNFT